MKMKIRNRTLFITMLFCGVILPLSLNYAAANPPDYVLLAYDEGTEELTVTIGHSVSNPATHYVKSVAITINSVLNSTKSYTSQPDNTEFDYVYSLSLLDGDVVSVTATCNLSGNSEGTLTIGEETTTSDPSTDDPTEEGTIPGYTLFTLMLSLMTLGVLFRHVSRLRQR
jgi:hypothetical protein